MTATSMVDFDPEKKVESVTIKNLYIFVGATVLLVSYILYMMIRSRKGERPGYEDRDSEL